MLKLYGLAMTLTAAQIDRLASQRTIDLTTFGRKTGLPRRIEIWWFRVGYRFIISGSPGRRDWLANIRANNKVLIHAEGMDIDATAIEIVEEEFRRQFFREPQTRWYSNQAQLDRLVTDSPMVEIVFD